MGKGGINNKAGSRFLTFRERAIKDKDEELFESNLQKKRMEKRLKAQKKYRTRKEESIADERRHLEEERRRKERQEERRQAAREERRLAARLARKNDKEERAYLAAAEARERDALRKLTTSVGPLQSELSVAGPQFDKREALKLPGLFVTAPRGAAGRRKPHTKEERAALVAAIKRKRLLEAPQDEGIVISQTAAEAAAAAASAAATPYARAVAAGDATTTLADPRLDLPPAPTRRRKLRAAPVTVTLLPPPSVAAEAPKEGEEGTVDRTAPLPGLSALPESSAQPPQPTPASPPPPVEAPRSPATTYAAAAAVAIGGLLVAVLAPLAPVSGALVLAASACVAGGIAATGSQMSRLDGAASRVEALQQALAVRPPPAASSEMPQPSQRERAPPRRREALAPRRADSPPSPAARSLGAVDDMDKEKQRQRQELGLLPEHEVELAVEVAVAEQESSPLLAPDLIEDHIEHAIESLQRPGALDIPTGAELYMEGTELASKYVAEDAPEQSVFESRYLEEVLKAERDDLSKALKVLDEEIEDTPLPAPDRSAAADAELAIMEELSMLAGRVMRDKKVTYVQPRDISIQLPDPLDIPDEDIDASIGLLEESTGATMSSMIGKANITADSQYTPASLAADSIPDQEFDTHDEDDSIAVLERMEVDAKPRPGAVDLAPGGAAEADADLAHALWAFEDADEAARMAEIVEMRAVATRAVSEHVLHLPEGQQVGPADLEAHRVLDSVSRAYYSLFDHVDDPVDFNARVIPPADLPGRNVVTTLLTEGGVGAVGARASAHDDGLLLRRAAGVWDGDMPTSAHHTEEMLEDVQHELAEDAEDAAHRERLRAKRDAYLETLEETVYASIAQYLTMMRAIETDTHMDSTEMMLAYPELFRDDEGSVTPDDVVAFVDRLYSEGTHATLEELRQSIATLHDAALFRA